MVSTTSLHPTVDIEPLVTGNNSVTGILGGDELLNNGFTAGGARLTESTKALTLWF
jgi:hypothetical protein